MNAQQLTALMERLEEANANLPRQSETEVEAKARRALLEAWAAVYDLRRDRMEEGPR